MSNNSMKLTENIRYGWLGAIGSVVWLVIFILMQFTANQHISQLGNIPTELASVALLVIFCIFIAAMMILAEEIIHKITRDWNSFRKVKLHLTYMLNKARADERARIVDHLKVLIKERKPNDKYGRQLIERIIEEIEESD